MSYNFQQEVREISLLAGLLCAAPLALVSTDVSDWCKDARHPYYIHFCSTRKALRLAEREQKQREAAAAQPRLRKNRHVHLEKRLRLPSLGAKNDKTIRPFLHASSLFAFPICAWHKIHGI